MAAQESRINGTICESVSTQNCQTISLSISELPYQQLPPAADLAFVWGVAFTSIISLYFFSHGIGLILKFVRNA